MKKIVVLLSLCFFIGHLFSQSVFFRERFDAGVLPIGWTTVDADGDSYNWMFLPKFKGHGGIGGCISSASYLGVPLNPDNWLISPEFNITDTMVLRYFVSAQDIEHPVDKYQVLVSKSGNGLSDFTDTLFTETIVSKSSTQRYERSISREQGTWYERTIGLPLGTKYIAWRHFGCTDKFFINIDDVEVAAFFTTPYAQIRPEKEWNAGVNAVGSTKISEVFAIKNIGVDTLRLLSATIENIVLPFSCTIDSAQVKLAQDSVAIFTFTYSPIIVDTNIQNIVIKTNVGDINFTLKGITLDTVPIAKCDTLFWNASETPIGSVKVSDKIILKNAGFLNLKCTSIEGLEPPFSCSLLPDVVDLAHDSIIKFSFSFAPTTTNDVAQVITIKTNGGDIAFTLKGKGVNCSDSVINTLPLTETFDVGIPICWTNVDGDRDGHFWQFGFERYGKTIVSYSAILISEDPDVFLPLTPNNYIISPELSGVLSIDYKVGSLAYEEYIGEHYAVCASTIGKDTSDFSIVFQETLDNSFVETDELTARHINLPIGTKYIAFRHFNCNDKFSLLIDEVKFNNFSTIGIENVDDVLVSIFPNPVENYFNVSVPEPAKLTIRDISGKIALSVIVKNNDIIFVENLEKGIYFVSFDIKGIIANKKLIIK